MGDVYELQIWHLQHLPFQAESFAGNSAAAESDTEPKLAPFGLRTTFAAKMRQHFLRE
jgi:hypothetical protein